MLDDDVQSFPLIGSIQNSVGMGFLGNQACFAIVNALGGRVVHAWSQFASAHGGVPGRTTVTADVAQFRRDVNFVIAQRPGILHVGYLPKPMHVDVVANAIKDYKGVVLLDPVIGDYKKGMYVTEETARAIRDWLFPLAQIVTPNRFEAEVMLGSGDSTLTEFALLNEIYDLGPHTAVITSYTKDAEKHRTTSLFTNGYSYYRISGPYLPRYAAHGVGDVFASAMTAFIGLGGSPFAAALLSTALATRAVAHSTTYGGSTVDPIAALAKWNPQGYQMDDDRAMRFCEKSSVDSVSLKTTAIDSARLKFAPPKHKIIYG
ncbi:MAG TPA: bifunctional hydroxymethylpyrimidine kinase/phosphomethylpyrimidine kinase [Candidatus Baltobacteraceae bacterium]|nr:bifunctional hydroxymethylpyrimidine kinase/phosphomethylpyrimidine kinase [Candidatus Baltobacteraceae bacterium]